MLDAANLADAAWRRGLEPEPQLTVSSWADQHRVLPSLTAEPGRWRTDRTPYLREIMDALSVGNPIERVVFMKGAQIGATEAGLNWLGFIIHHAPGLVLAVMPSIESVRRNAATRIEPLIETTPALRERVAPRRSRDADNSITRKRFPGGMLVLTGANSAVGLRSTPARYLFLDEVDGYPADADGEGDPVALAIQRTVTFRGRRKIFLVSTPTLKGFSRIEAAYLETDQRRFFVPCLHCGGRHTLEWERVRWPEGRPGQAYVVCPACGGVIEERDKPALLEAGEWRATAKGDGRSAGFHLSALYSPFETWGEIAIEHGLVARDPARLQVWTNVKLGLSWEDQAGVALDAEGLAGRREDWGPHLPAGVAVLTAGVDVQGDRVEVQVVGWSRDEEAWIVDYRVIWGDPTAPKLWEDLDQYLARTFDHARELAPLPIRAVAIDTGGHATASVYRFVSTRLGRRIWGIKGRAGQGLAIWPRRPTKARGKVPLFIVGVDSAKDLLAARLRVPEPGPGYVHFGLDRDPEYFAQLTAERVLTRYLAGRPQRQWVLKDGVRNEALDTAVYAIAALHGLYSMGFNLTREAAALTAAPLRKEGAAAPLPLKPRPAVIKSPWMTW